MYFALSSISEMRYISADDVGAISENPQMDAIYNVCGRVSIWKCGEDG